MGQKAAKTSTFSKAYSLTLAAVLLICGCSRSTQQPERYQTFSGTVLNRWAENGQLKIEVQEPRGNRFAGQALDCVVTSDSELYLNGVFSGLIDIAVDDQIDVIGYFGKDAPQQFWVTFGFASRPQPDYPVPEIKQTEIPAETEQTEG